MRDREAWLGEVKKSGYFVLASAVAAILWLVAGWLLPGVPGVGSLLALLAAANAPLLAPRLRKVELPGGIKLHFSAHEEEPAARGRRGTLMAALMMSGVCSRSRASVEMSWVSVRPVYMRGLGLPEFSISYYPTRVYGTFSLSSPASNLRSIKGLSFSRTPF